MGKRRAKEPETAPNHERWLITYADLITLLMIFFILMYTISNVNAKKFEQLSSSLNRALIGENSGHVVGEAPGVSLIDEGLLSGGSQSEQKAIDKVQEELEKYIEEEGLEGRVIVIQEERGLVVSLKETMFFKIGSAEINPSAKETISKIGEFLLDMPNQVRIEGHTDNLPIHTAKFPSNWELSTARATNVLRYLINDVDLSPERLSATGYGEFRPIKSNTNEENRRMNRRVDIVLLRTVFNKAEPNSINN